MNVSRGIRSPILPFILFLSLCIEKEQCGCVWLFFLGGPGRDELHTSPHERHYDRLHHDAQHDREHNIQR